MNMCITIDGKTHSYEIAHVTLPIAAYHHRPGPINIPFILREATVLASVQAAADSLSDDGVRGVLHDGINAAWRTLQERAGAHIKFEKG
jgi:hypothetical protein